MPNDRNRAHVNLTGQLASPRAEIIAIRANFLMAGILAIGLVGVGCAPVDVSGLDPLTGYEQWYRVDASGRVPGHGDSYRIIYANDAARQYLHEGRYPFGSVIVKEIRDADGGENGALDYIAVMRKLPQAPPGGELEGGWLFTMMSEQGADETQSFVCWQSCHVQAPVDGAFLDYGQ